MAERGVRASMPVVDHEQSRPFFPHRDFTSDAATHTYRCPQGETLRYRGTSYRTRSRFPSAPTGVCQTGPLRERGTDSGEGRKLSRSFDEASREQARQVQTTAAYQKALRKRAVWVEPLFGEAKEWHGLRHFRLRGLDQVNIEGLFVAAGQDLKRWLAAVGGGRRPATGAAPLRILASSWLPLPGAP